MNTEERTRDILLNITGEKALADYRPNHFEYVLEHIQAVASHARRETLLQCEQACLHMEQDFVCPEECAAIIRDMLKD